MLSARTNIPIHAHGREMEEGSKGGTEGVREGIAVGLVRLGGTMDIVTSASPPIPFPHPRSYNSPSPPTCRRRVRPYQLLLMVCVPLDEINAFNIVYWVCLF